MTIFWIIVTIAGFLLMLLLLMAASFAFGRGHLGNENLSREHYIDEVDVMAHFPHG